MDANAVLLSIKDKIPDSSLAIVQDKLKVASEDKLNTLMVLPLKNVIIGLVLGLLFGGFGIDRFYKGDIGLGIAKLVLWILGCATVIFYIGAVFLIILWVWVIVDFFLVWKGIKQDNLNKILAVLS
ncbi:TM2 domain-containing protein [Campylobacter sp. MIT 12-8780]|uniref:NINE protein n=1 Tax=unclassified Campylobacter TaxID=2593542 RepID=UPI00115E8462|nr:MULTISPECIES: NINE protein [unclassified Campylobacter]NDJ26916.1 TM2 domain-containing protein [Campylobacter sp. MIT 19-121]TQR41939.1 TM2 domain-containing protein [Campylobacter sp. MIT 12-8780]